jgi:hypothetical protein
MTANTNMDFRSAFILILKLCNPVNHGNHYVYDSQELKVTAAIDQNMNQCFKISYVHLFSVKISSYHMFIT